MDVDVDVAVNAVSSGKDAAGEEVAAPGALLSVGEEASSPSPTTAITPGSGANSNIPQTKTTTTSSWTSKRAMMVAREEGRLEKKRRVVREKGKAVLVESKTAS